MRDSDNNGGSAAKVAVTLLAASIVTLQAPVPEQAPDQPPNCEPEAGVAVRDTTVRAAYVPLTGAGLAVIVPEPTVDRLRMNCGAEFTVQTPEAQMPDCPIPTSRSGQSGTLRRNCHRSRYRLRHHLGCGWRSGARTIRHSCRRGPGGKRH